MIFVGVLGYFGAHRLLLKGIDERRDRIKVEFDEARRLKAEAEALLAAYRRKQHEAEDAARAIVTSAKAEAERLAVEAEAKLEEFVARRTKMAENKIVSRKRKHSPMSDPPPPRPPSLPRWPSSPARSRTRSPMT